MGRKYRLEFTPEQAAFVDEVGAICRVVWNTGLEQRREYRRRGGYINYSAPKQPTDQARELAAAKQDHLWLTLAPSHVLQQTLMDLDRACRTHGTFRVRWRSARRWPPSFRFPDPKQIQVERLNHRWGRVKLPKFGWVRFRWSRALDGQIRSVTVSRNGTHWFVSILVDTKTETPERHAAPGTAVGVDRGVAVAVAASDGQLLDRVHATPGELRRVRRLQQQLGRQRKRSNRRKATLAKLAALFTRISNRRKDFCAQTAHTLATGNELVVLEALRTKNMTRSAAGTAAEPGTNVRQKAGLNRSILDKGWHQLELALRGKARVTGTQIVLIDPAYTSQTCHACGHVARESRESQTRFRCVTCGHQDHADVNAAKNILAAGLAATGRGDLGATQSLKRQPPATAAPAA